MDHRYVYEDEEVRHCVDGIREMFAGVIDKAVRDATYAPDHSHWKTEAAIDAIDFLFRGDAAGVEAYLHWMDIDPGEFRRRLWALIDDERNPIFKPVQRRAFRYNYKLWRSGRRSTGFEQPEDAEAELEPA